MSTKSTQDTRRRALRRLECRLKRDLDTLSYPSREWVLSRSLASGENILDALIVGGGQSGLAIAFGLMREKVGNILVVDRNPEGLEGPWRTFARMATLRTPKNTVGADFGVTSLTFSAWYQAMYGLKAWKALGFPPTEVWADYLSWYRKVLAIPAQNDTTVGAISFDSANNCFLVPTNSKAGEKTLYARKVVLATGIDGSGAWQSPKCVTHLPRHLWAHTSEAIDFAKLRGKRIGVLGAGASAFDNAICAIKSGCLKVDLCFRRSKIPNINPYRCQEYVGFLKHHVHLPDDLKWRFIVQILRMGQTPPKATYLEAVKHSNFYMHPLTEWRCATADGDCVKVETTQGTMEFDFVIIGTGYITDLSLRPELALFQEHIARWSDRFVPQTGDEDGELLLYPYLGSHFQFQEKVPGQAPYLNSIFSFTLAGLPSVGFGGASISGMKYSLPRLISGVTRQLYVDDGEEYLRRLCCFKHEEF